MNDRSRLITVLLCTILLAGCQPTSKPAAAPPKAPSAPPVVASASGASPQTPASTPTVPTTGCTRQPNQALGVWGAVQDPFGLPGVENGTCRAHVDTGPVTITFWLPPGATEAAARAALNASGAAAPTVSFQPVPQHPYLQVVFQAGQPGETLSVRLHGPIGTDGQLVDMAYELQRTALSVQMDLQQPDGSWAPFANGTTLSRGPLTLRLRTQGPVSLASLQSTLAAAVPKGSRLEEQSEGTWHIGIDNPPARLLFDFRNTESTEGLRLRQGVFLLYTGEAPALVSLDPVSGQEQRIGSAPPDVTEAQLSPDGRYAMLIAYAPEFAWEVWVADLQTGELRKTPFTRDYFAAPVIWRPDALVIPRSHAMQIWHLPAGVAETHTTAADQWVAPSPDGRYVAGFSLDFSRESPEFITPATVAVFDLTTGQEHTFADRAHGLIPHNESPLRLRMAWHGNDQSLLLQDYTGRDMQTQKLTERVLLLDLATGTTTPTVETLPIQSWEAWESWLKGPGGWQANHDDWGPIRLVTPAGAEDLHHGTGRVVGFTPQGRLILLRWPNYEQRLTPMGM